MVAPTYNVGALVVENTSTSYRNQSVRWRQTMPIDRPLAFASQAAKRMMGTEALAANSTPGNAATWYAYETGSSMNPVVAKAYDRLRSEVGSQASVGAALAELTQSVGMIAERMLQLMKLARALRRLDFNQVARVLRASSLPRGKKMHRSFASLWLEYSFGWKPLIGDIYHSVNVLQSDIPNFPVKGSAKDVIKTAISVTGSVPGGTYTRNWGEFFLRCKMGAEVSVTNPNLYLANALGLANPATIAWEVIPFSFVVDWFVNVEQFLSQGTDFLGLAVKNGYTSKSQRGTVTFESQNVFATPGSVRKQTYYVTRVSRTLGVTSPGLFVRPWAVPGWGRAANATSVFIQQLRR